MSLTVGGGTGGCALADSLADDPSIRVLLLEAGRWPSPLASVPLLSPMLALTEGSWNYLSAPQKHSHRGFNQQVRPKKKAPFFSLVAFFFS